MSPRRRRSLPSRKFLAKLKSAKPHNRSLVSLGIFVIPLVVKVRGRFHRIRMTLTLPYAEVLAENNRLNEVPKIVTTFEELVVSARGQVKATITTAQVGVLDLRAATLWNTSGPNQVMPSFVSITSLMPQDAPTLTAMVRCAATRCK